MVREEEPRHCLEHFNLPRPNGAKADEGTGPFDILFRNPFEKRTGAAAPSTVWMMPGVEVIDMYTTSIETEVWKDGRVLHCLVPKPVVGWEFYSLLWPAPDGSTPLKLCPQVELLGARPPGGPVCPSLLFAFVPVNYHYSQNASRSSAHPPSAESLQPEAGQGTTSARTSLNREREHGNIDMHNRTKAGRIVALCPSTVYKDSVLLPDEHSWGLFIGPRSRTLVLLNRKRGRIDLHLAMLLGFDAAFRMCDMMISALSRLFEPFGTQDRVPALFGANLEPLKVHSGLTNALVADHISVSADGREDYQRVFGVSLPSFFLSNASSNLLFLSPSEAQLQRSASNIPELAQPDILPDIPQWTKHGPISQAQISALRTYRERVHLIKEETPVALIQHPLGTFDAVGWLSSIGAHCSSVISGGGPEPAREGRGADPVMAELAMPVGQQPEQPWQPGQPPQSWQPPEQSWQQQPPPSPFPSNSSQAYYANGSQGYPQQQQQQQQPAQSHQSYQSYHHSTPTTVFSGARGEH